MIGKKVQVYFNLHKKCFSVKDKKTRLVIAHVNSICLENVVFKVSEKGRQRVLSEKRKNVHAVVEGDITGVEGLGEISITYNPYKYKSFIIKGSDKPIANCKHVAMFVNNKIPTIIGGNK